MLTVSQVRAAEPMSRPYKIADGQGLLVHVLPTGRKIWRMRFRYAGKEQVLTFGAFPEVSLAEARAQRDDARLALRQHQNPAEVRRRARSGLGSGMTFEDTARAWHEQQLPRWSKVHAADVLSAFKRHVFPRIGRMPLGAIQPSDLLAVMHVVESAGAVETAHRIRRNISAVFARAAAEGAVVTNPAATIAPAMSPRPDPTPQSAMTEISEIAAAYRQIAVAVASRPAIVATQLLALTAVRPGVLRSARWRQFENIDLDGEGEAPEAIWRVPADCMKLRLSKKKNARYDHVIPLSRAAVELLRGWRQRCRTSDIVFPGRAPSRPIGENAIYQVHVASEIAERHSPHGWRAAFSTIMNERRPNDRRAIDLTLAHGPKDKVEAAYNRSTQIARRRALLQEWADLLDGHCSGASSTIATS